MPDGNFTDIKKKYSKRFDRLMILGDCFVQRDYEPADLETEIYVECLRDRLQLVGSRPTSHQKYIRCLSDFLVAAKTSATGYICWTGKDSDYVGFPYSGTVAREVRARLIAYGFLQEVQKQSKGDDLARVYKVDERVVSKSLKFNSHGIGPEVIVRTASKIVKGKKQRGDNISRKRFMPDILPLEAQVKEINRCMAAHPLEDLNEQEHARCYRVFNDGKLTVGGRLYGGFQQYSEEERLLSLIDGEVVCEIDFKASYLSIINILLGEGEDLGRDPYSNIRFVRQENDPERQKTMRSLAKRLVAAYVGRVNKEGVKDPEVKKFPKGKRVKDQVTGEVRTVSLQEEFDLSQDHNVKTYMDDIFEAFPFLRSVCHYSENVMFKESQVLIGAMESLARKDVPAYPIHDCLLVKFSDREKVIRELHLSQIAQLGKRLPMDLSYHQQDGEIITEIVPLPIDLKDQEIALPKNSCTTHGNLKYDWGEENFEVIEDD